MPQSSTEGDPLDVAASEFTELLRQGKPADIEEFARRYPGLADEIRELFPTIVITEKIKTRQARSTGGRASLGSARLDRLGDFRIVRELGRGGMGVVFEAEQESLQRRVAVKVLPRQALLDDQQLRRFEREARIAASLHHTNIVEVFGVGEQDGFHYYVMQLIDGVGLDVVIARLARLPGNNPLTRERPGAPIDGPSSSPHCELADLAVRQWLKPEALENGSVVRGPAYWRGLARLGLQAADALAYAHGLGVLHRDIKPGNLLVDTHGNVWLADFGLAKAAQAANVSVSHDLVGTLRYIAPEQLRGAAEPRSDVYSLGLSLYELAALRPAYDEADQSRLLQRLNQGPPPAPPGSFGLRIPLDLETIILKAIASDPASRYASAADLREDLRAFLEDRPIQARRASPLERLSRWSRRNKALAALAGVSLFLLVLVALVAALGYLHTKNALAGEAKERQRAETNAALAFVVLDRMFAKFAAPPLRLAARADWPSGADHAPPQTSSPALSAEAAAVLEEMLPFCDSLARQSATDPHVQVRIADATRRVGAIRQRLGQTEEARQAYQRAVGLYTQLHERSPHDPGLRLSLAQIHNELGRLHASQWQSAQSRQAHLQALSLLAPEASLTSASDGMRFELARTCYFLGTRERPLPETSSRPGDRPASEPPPADDRLAQAVTLLTEGPPYPEQQHLLALCYLEGAAVPGLGSPGPEGGLEEALRILEALVKSFPGNPDYAYDLAEAYARIHLPQGRPLSVQAESRLQDRLTKSLALLEQLAARYPDVPDFVASEARVQDKLGAFYRQLERWTEAGSSFQKAVATQTSLVTRFPNVPAYQLWMATYRIHSADALLRLRQPQPAREELEKALSSLTEPLDLAPDGAAPHELLALGYSRLATALRQLGEPAKADEAAVRAERERNAVPRGRERDGAEPR